MPSHHRASSCLLLVKHPSMQRWDSHSHLYNGAINDASAGHTAQESQRWDSHSHLYNGVVNDTSSGYTAQDSLNNIPFSYGSSGANQA